MTTGAQGKSPATFAVEPGKHRIFAEKEGHASENVEVDVKKGTSPSFSVSLKKSKGKGKVKLVVAPKGTVVAVNGEELGKAPFAELVSMQEGTYWVTATAPDHEPWTGTLLVHPGKTAKFSVSLRSTIPPEPFPYDDAALYSGVGGAGALLVGGLVAALAYGAHSDLEKDQDQGQPLDADDVDAGRTYWVSAQVLGGLGALGLITSGVFYYLGADDDPASAGPDKAAPAARRPTDLGLTPVVGLGGAGEPGLLLRGTF